MLKTECPKCNEWIHLPFHSDHAEIVCPCCTESIEVKEVYVSAGPFTISKEVLQKNIFKYKRLIQEAEREALEIQKKGDGSKHYEVSAKSVRMLVANLKEMLDGCRRHLRHSVEDESVEYEVGRAEA